MRTDYWAARRGRFLRLVAHHEAGHATVCLLFNHHFEHVSLYPQPFIGRSGLCFGEVDRGETEPSYPGIEMAICSIAGPFAEALFSRRPLMEVLRGDGMGDLIDAGRHLGFVKSGFDKHRLYRAAGITRWLIRKHWPTVRLLAGALLTRHRLDRRAVLALTGSALLPGTHERPGAG